MLCFGKKLLKKILSLGAKKLGNEGLKNFSDTYENIYNEIFGIKPLNKGENETIEQMLQGKDPMEKNIEDWNDDDAQKIYHSPDFQYNQNKQTKFNQYLNHRRYKSGY